MTEPVQTIMLKEIQRQVKAWLDQHHCVAAQCPKGCQHPQPIIAYGKYICGRCYHVSGIVTEMIPWTPGEN